MNQKHLFVSLPRYQCALLFCILGFVLPLAGCGGGGGGATSPISRGNSIIGSAGGPAKTTDERAQANFPAGVFSTDTTVTITNTSSVPTTTTAGQRLVSGTAYDFGPSGVFNNPVSITIKYDATRLPSGAQESNLQIYKVVGSDWQPIANSVVDTTTKTVTAPVTGFSTYGILANNQFAGTYSGTYSGNSTGTWQATVDVNGHITATASGGFQGTGTITFTGATTLPLQGTGTSQGYHITFNGNFTLANSGGVTGNGTWVSSSGYTGAWTGSRTNP